MFKVNLTHLSMNVGLTFMNSIHIFCKYLNSNFIQCSRHRVWMMQYYYYLKPYLILNKVVDDERLGKILHGHGELEKTEIRKFVTES